MAAWTSVDTPPHSGDDGASFISGVRTRGTVPVQPIQVEIQRLGQLVNLDVVVYEIADRRGKRLEAQTQVQDPFHNRVVFYIRNAETFDQVQTKLQAQLIHRGYAPSDSDCAARIRRTGATKWLEWQVIEGGIEAIREMVEASLESGSKKVKTSRR